MILKVKQVWGFAILLALSFIYVFIYLITLDSEEPDVKEIYFADRISIAHQILIDKYNELHKGEVKIIPIDFSNYDFSTNERKELFARSLRGRGDGIDLFGVDVIWTKRFAQWSEPLDNYFSKEELNSFVQQSLKSCYADNKLFAVPLVVSYGVIFYREDIISQLQSEGKLSQNFNTDMTWEEFIELGKSLHLENPFYIFPAAEYEGLICVFHELLLGMEPNYFENHGFNFDTQSALKSLNLLVDLVNRYNLTPKAVTEFTEIPSYEYFLENDGLFIRGWQTYRKDFQLSPFDSLKEANLKEMPIPYFADGKPATTFGGWNLMISKFSSYKEEVIEFVKFLLSESSQDVFYREAGFLPVITKFYEDEKFLKKYPEIYELKKIFEKGVHRPAHKNYTKYSEIISHYLTLAIKNEITPQEALKAATKDIQLDKMLVK